MLNELNLPSLVTRFEQTVTAALMDQYDKARVSRQRRFEAEGPMLRATFELIY